MRSLGLANNNFTDNSMNQLIFDLRHNTHLNHLNLTGCIGVTDVSLKAMNDMITQLNMCLYNIELSNDYDQYDEELVEKIQFQAKMNREIQEHLKPVKIESNGMTEIKFNGNVCLADYFDSGIKTW